MTASSLMMYPLELHFVLDGGTFSEKRSLALVCWSRIRPWTNGYSIGVSIGEETGFDSAHFHIRLHIARRRAVRGHLAFTRRQAAHRGALDAFGIDFIEGGFPASNPKDIEFFRRVKEMPLDHARIAAFGSTCKKDTPADQDQGLADSSSAELLWQLS